LVNSVFFWLADIPALNLSWFGPLSLAYEAGSASPSVPFFLRFLLFARGATRSFGPNPLAYDPRGSGLSKEGYTASDVCGYAAHIAAGTERPYYQNKTSHRAYRAGNRTIIFRVAFPAISSLEFLGRTSA
jgi:hypothetical protein